jgi:hypothetical protein
MRPMKSLGFAPVGSKDTLVVETEMAFVILGLLLVFLPMFLTVLLRAEESETFRLPRPIVVALAWSVPLLIVVAGLDATLGLVALWGHPSASKPVAFILVVLTWLVVGLAVVAVKFRAA